LTDQLIRELAAHGIHVIDGKSYHWKDEKFSFDQIRMSLKSITKDNKKILLRLWGEVSEVLQKKETGDSDEMSELLFVPAIKGLYVLSSQFKYLKENGVCESLKAALSSDSNSFSRLVMNKVIDFRLAIEWMHHLIRRNMYLQYLIEYHRISLKSKNVEASGVSGPWSNLDLPMEERVFEWKDIEEEVAGREKDKRNQRRYRMGLENYGTGDHSPNEGFYWREMRNEPYSFGDESSNPYPHRNLLWV